MRDSSQMDCLILRDLHAPTPLSCCFCCMQVESVLDKDGYTLEELLDEEEIIQECKALNSRLINL